MNTIYPSGLGRVQPGVSHLRDFRSGYTEAAGWFHQGARYMHQFAGSVHRVQSMVENSSNVPLINDTARLLLDDPVISETIAQVAIADDVVQDVDRTLHDIVRAMHGKFFAEPSNSKSEYAVYPPRPAGIYHQPDTPGVPPAYSGPVPTQQDQGGIAGSRPYDSGFIAAPGFLTPGAKIGGRAVS